jgi:predicted dinucleotide-utilizing enzyme
MKKLKVGIIGCGTIGTALAQFLIKKERSRARLAFLCDRVPEKAKKLQTALPKNISITSISELIRKSDLVIETASVAVSGKVARDALRQHKQVLILSVGGLIKETGWLRAAQKTRGSARGPRGKNSPRSFKDSKAARQSAPCRLFYETRLPENAGEEGLLPF